MKLKVISTLSVASLALVFSACGGTAPSTNVTANIANKTANAANTVANTAGNMTNTVANTVSPNTTTTNTSSTASTAGDVISIDAAGIQVSAPKGFKVQKDGETTNLISADDAFEVYFQVPKDGDYDKAITAAAEEIDEYIKDIKMEGKGEKGNFGGMEAMLFDGTGVDKEEGKPVSFELIILDAPKKPVVIVSYGDKETNTKYSKEIAEIAKSIKKQ